MAISILLTGGLGFVGSSILDLIQERHPEWRITVLDLVRPDTPKADVQYEVGNILDLSSLNDIFQKFRPEVVVHTAGLVPDLAKRYTRDQQALVYRINVVGTQNMLKTAKAHGCRAFVWTGSCTAVTDDMRRDYRNITEATPTSTKSLIYGESKAIAEKAVIAANEPNFATCALRPSVLFGEGDYQLVPSVHACIAKWETPFVIGDGKNLWDATHVENIAFSHVLAVENLLTTKTAAGEAIFIANEEPITFRDFCLAVWANFGHYPPFTFHIPVAIAVLVGIIAEWVTWATGTSTTISRGSLLDAAATRYCSGSKARELLGYRPRVGVEEGLRRSCLEYAQRLKLQGRQGKPYSRVWRVE